MLWNSLKSRFAKGERPAGIKTESAGRTDVGLRRDHNEDAIFLSDDAGLYLVADGMGGHACGEVASAMAVETVSAQFLSSDREKLPLLLKEAILNANRRIFDYSREKIKPPDGTETLTGHGTMGTTIVALALFGETAAIANVGDSRAYRLRNGRLALLTKDHTLAASLKPPPGQAPAPSMRSKLKHVLTRALGVEAKVEIDLREERVEPGDLFLLCSDGLTNMLSDARMEEILSSFPVQAACETLVSEANRNGGKDNISCLLVRPR